MLGTVDITAARENHDSTVVGFVLCRIIVNQRIFLAIHIIGCVVPEFE
jgi:hypothetical protein